ncbi:MAG: hypothetical protein Q9171_003812 [Xanthocarpia ochracea]
MTIKSVEDFDERNQLVATLNDNINSLTEENKQLVVLNGRPTTVARNLADLYVGFTKLAERLDASFMALAGPARDTATAVRKVTKTLKSQGSLSVNKIQQLISSVTAAVAILRAP